jgi:hypothetical protein
LDSKFIEPKIPEILKNTSTPAPDSKYVKVDLDDLVDFIEKGKKLPSQQK